MYSISINNVLVHFIMFQDKSEDIERLQAAVQNAERVFFVDTPPTQEFLKFLKENSHKKLWLLDHHGIDNPKTEREREILSICEEQAALIMHAEGVYKRTSRRENPSCVSLVKGLVALPGDAIIADADLDGLLTAMALCGVVYDGIEKDAEVVDGPRALQKDEDLSPHMRLFKRALCSLPDFKDKNFLPMKEELYQAYVVMVRGIKAARELISSRAESYEKALAESERLLKEATTTFRDDAGFVWLTTTHTGEEKYLLDPIAKAHEEGLLSVISKKGGPIGDLFGVQYTIVRTQRGSHLNLLALVDDLPKGKEVGLIANQPFMIHTSHEVFNLIFPRLDKLRQTPV